MKIIASQGSSDLYPFLDAWQCCTAAHKDYERAERCLEAGRLEAGKLKADRRID